MDNFQDRELKLQFRNRTHPVETNVVHSARGVAIQFSRIKLPSEYQFQWDGRLHYLAHHDLVLRDGQMEVLGEKPTPGGDLRDLMTYAPQGRTINGWGQPARRRLNSFTVVYFDVEVLQEEFDWELRHFVQDPMIYFRHPELAATMRKLGRLMETCGQQLSRMQSETMGLLAALEVMGVGQGARMPQRTARALSPQQRRLVGEYIAEHLADEITLDELAGLCNLSRYHFSRVFKETFGQSPSKFIIARRIEKARELLSGTDLPLNRIATQCGFHGVTQLGRTFRSLEGTTPVRYRRSR